MYNLLKPCIHEYLDQEFIIDNPPENFCFQSGTTDSISSVDFEEDNTYLCDFIQDFQESSNIDEKFDQNFSLIWEENSLFDQKRHKELKDLTLELATGPSPNSELLVNVTETLNSVLQHEFKDLDFQMSSFEKQSDEQI